MSDGRREQLRRAEGGGFLLLTNADTDLLALSQVAGRLSPEFPPVRGHSISHLREEGEARAFVDAVVAGAQVVILRLLGGSGGFRGGFQRLLERAARHDFWLICVPGTDTPDPELTAASNVGAPTAHEVFAYLQFGGLKNLEHMLRFLSDHLLTTGFGYEAPEPQPRHGVYYRSPSDLNHQGPTFGLLFYRSHLLSGNTAFVDALIRSSEDRGARVIAVYTSSLRDYEAGEQVGAPAGAAWPTALQFFAPDGVSEIDVLITTTSFAASAGTDGAGTSNPLEALDVPVLQAIASSGPRESWLQSFRGLGPVDIAINVAIPELDGRIISLPVSFKAKSGPGLASGEPAVQGQGPVLYVPEPERVERVIGQALRLAALRRKPNSEKRVAFVLTNYSARASRVANAVGLDSPASLLRVLQAMGKADYRVGVLPPSPDELVHALIDRGNYDQEVLTAAQLERAAAKVSGPAYAGWFHDLAERNQREMADRWGKPPGAHYVDATGNLALAGLESGNVFVAVQPPRGYGMDPGAIYHAPDLPPPHPYFALYRWLAQPAEAGGWAADAIVHLGKHGSLEWLPGKGVGLSEECYPDAFLGDIPLVYPFIVNNPGEGAQAKRRTHAVIIDHLTPPLTTAEGYGEVEQLARLVDEYYQLEQLDPSKLPLLQQQIWALIQQAHLDADLPQLVNWDSSGGHTHEWDSELHPDGVPHALSDMGGRDFAHLVENINGYLCELTSAQIRDGLHILGQAPESSQLVDTILAMVRVPNAEVPSLRSGVAEAFGLDLGVILDSLGKRFAVQPVGLEQTVGHPLPTHADALEAIDEVCRQLVERLAEQDFSPEAVPETMEAALGPAGSKSTEQTLDFLCGDLVPRLRRTEDEIVNLLRALDGQYVPPGPSGAPTRGMVHVLPTGRNFYTVDPRSLPTAAAWAVGQQLAEALITRYLAEEGRYPESVGLSIWGTSLMRTHGDDVAQVLALLGVRPRWQPESRRVLGFEIIPLSELGRPRVDVVCRISGFFRDAFPDLIALLDDAFRAVAELEESLEMNPLRRHALAQRGQLEAGGTLPEEAARRSTYRIFGSPPGAYGAGLLPLIDERNWRDDADLAEVYVNWGGYVYARDAYGEDARADFRAALAGVQVAAKNQDNREHDILDSDDYFQYHGGMIATIRALAGRNPRRYFGDSSDPARPRVRDLKEETLRVFRTRVTNPKWIVSIQRHGYKGALELAATVDYLFGYDATAQVVDDWMYERVAQEYALDPEMQSFFAAASPWALRDITSRLMEAIDRDMWEHPPPEVRDGLRNAYLKAEADIEARAGGEPSPA